MNRFLSILILSFFILTGCYSQDNNGDFEVDRITVDHIPITLVYHPSGKTYYDYYEKKTLEMLDYIKIYFISDNSRTFLGEINRNGVFNSQGENLYTLPVSREGAYVSPRNLDAIYSINYIEYIDGIYAQADTVANIRINLHKMTIERFIPNIY